MARIIPSQQASTAIAELKKLYPAVTPLTSKDKLFADFTRIIQENGGRILTGLNESRPGIAENGSHTRFQQLVAWFSDANLVNAFAIALYDPSTGEYALNHQEDPRWPEKLTVELENGIRLLRLNLPASAIVN